MAGDQVVAGRQQVGRVAFEHQAPAWDVTHQRMQVGATTLVANPAGNADVQVEVAVGMLVRYVEHDGRD